MSVSFDPKTYFPDQRFSTQVVKERLSRSILHTVSEEEAKLRIQLAAVYRLYAKYKLTDGIFNHTTVKIPGAEHAYLINPLGLDYSEITASSFIKIDLEGNILDPGVLGDLMKVNKAGLVIHSAVHAAHPDIVSISHLHYAPAAAVASTKEGLIYLTQTSHAFGPVSYHPYEGLAIDKSEQERLVKDMGNSKVLLLPNHGVLTVGKSISEAFFYMVAVCKACEIQALASSAAFTRDNLIVPDKKLVERQWDLVLGFTGVNQIGLLELCAEMRLLDKEDPSYRN